MQHWHGTEALTLTPNAPSADRAKPGSGKVAGPQKQSSGFLGVSVEASRVNGLGNTGFLCLSSIHCTPSIVMAFENHFHNGYNQSASIWTRIKTREIDVRERRNERPGMIKITPMNDTRGTGMMRGVLR